MDFISLESQGHRATDTGQDDDIEQLADQAFNPNPMDHIAGAKIDDKQSATSFGVSILQLVIELEPVESLVVPRPFRVRA